MALGIGIVQADVFLVPQIFNARRFKVDLVSTKCPKATVDFRSTGHLGI